MKHAILVAAMCAACSKAERAKPPPPSEGIEMIDPGGAPRRVLRYHLTKGAKAPLELAMDLDMAIADRGGAMPTVVMLMEIRAEDVAADGSTKVRTKVVSASARARSGKETVVPVDMLTAQASQLAGLELTSTLSPAGRLSDSKVDVASKELPASFAAQIGQLGQSLEQVAMLLPEVPIGPGAKWKNRKTVRQNNVTMQTITTIELVAIDGDKLTFKSSAEVTGADQTIEYEGHQIAISGIGGGGRGRGVVDLGRMVMAGELGAEFHFDMTAQDTKSPASMEVAMRMRPLESIEASVATDPSQQAALATPDTAEKRDARTPADGKAAPVRTDQSDARRPADGKAAPVRTGAADQSDARTPANGKAAPARPGAPDTAGKSDARTPADGKAAPAGSGAPDKTSAPGPAAKAIEASPTAAHAEP